MTNEIQSEIDDELSNVQDHHPELFPKKPQVYTPMVNQSSD